LVVSDVIVFLQVELCKTPSLHYQVDSLRQTDRHYHCDAVGALVVEARGF